MQRGVMAMRPTSKLACAGVSALLGATMLAGCAKADATPDFSGVKDIAELSALECYYHNVVKYHRDADGWLFGLGNIGEKNMWFEYDGIVEMGVDIDQVKISEPDANGVIAITIPQIMILGHPDIDTDSMTDPIEANGWFTGLTANEKNEALAEAQANLMETALADERAKLQAKERTKSLLEQYVKNVGEAIGKVYTVKWEEIEAEQVQEGNA